MDEIYWKVISILSSLADSAIVSYYLTCLVKPFLKDRKYTWLCGVAYFVVMLIPIKVPPYLNRVIIYGAELAVVFVVLFLIDYRNIAQKIYLAVTFLVLRWITRGIAVSIYLPITDGLSYLQAKTGANQEQWFASYVVTSVFLVLLDWLLIAAAVKSILKAYLFKKDHMPWREMFFFLLPTCSVLLGYIIFVFCEAVYEADTGEMLGENYLYQCLHALYQLVSFVAIVAAVIAFQDNKRRQKEEKRRENLAGQIESMKMHIAEVEKLYRDIRSLKHDMGNHIMTLERLNEKKEYGAAQEYMMQLKQRFYDTAAGIKSGNPVTDVILLEKQKEALERGIDFCCEFLYPKEIRVDAFDVSVILNNALANALEGAAGCRHPYVHILSYRRKNAFLIEVMNSIRGRVEIEEGSGLPETTKEDGEGHGFGLANIREAAQKYYGDIEIEQTGEKFKLTILLMLG